MRKEKIITRTFTIYDIEILGFNTDTSEQQTKHFSMTRKFSDVKKLIEFIRKSEEKNNSSFVPVKVLFVTQKNELRGMTESHFMEESTILPPRINTNDKNN